MKQYLAFDLGASSGRAILGTLDHQKITLEELHRFENGGTEINGGLFWNIVGLFQELKTGLKEALKKTKKLDGIAIDTWGVDYCLLDKHGFLTGLPHHYRDPRTDHIMPWTFNKISAEKIYQSTGIQFMSLNTIFQLAKSVENEDPELKIADKLLFMPNALTWLFCGNCSAEYSIASTSQLYNPITKDWAWDIMDAIGIPKNIFPKIAPSCTPAGTLLPSLQKELKCGPLPVILIGSHDTASAVAAVPADNSKKWAYLSSGTWSLLGVERDKPILSEKAQKANYTNEGGVGNKIRFLKNIMGLWLIQECRNEWIRQGHSFSFGELVTMAEKAEPFFAYINPNDDTFLPPGDMPQRIADFCKKTGQKPPQTPGQIIRIIIESLALFYRHTINELEDILNDKLEVLHLVGGGCQNELLNQFTANACNLPVITGPIEATALGNIAGQALATGDISSLQEARAIIGNSTNNKTYTPEKKESWEKAYQAFASFL